ncbi:fibronectin type III domain-containing protein [bacterium]|nr:fibronectin type III domain-containing protein [bacterium]
MSVASIPVGGTAKSYQWLKDGVTISGATNADYSIAAVMSLDAGPYVCRITDANVPGLELYSRVFTLNVINPPLVATDSLALVALYDSLGGTNWTNQNNWKSSNPVSQWFGITVTPYAAVSRVTAINLYNNNLTGRMPAAIGNLDSLESLDLSYNKLNGTIPDQITNLKALSHLNLYGQTYVDYQIGGLTGSIPVNIGQMTSLELLYLQGNKLTGSIPAGLGNLSRLTSLSLASNQLTGAIPIEIWNLANLIYLDLSWNNGLSVGALPASITNLTSLNDLYLYQCGITSLPNMSSMTNLRTLGLGYNQLTGAIPSWIGSLSQLTGLNLSSNQFSPAPFPSFFTTMTSLTNLELFSDSITGSIPNLSALTNLYYLNLQNNQIVDFPDLSSMTTLNNLHLTGNRLNFADIQPNIIPGRYIQYGNQAAVGTAKDTTLQPSDTYVMSVSGIDVGGTANQYQWAKNFNDIIGATGSDYTIISATPADNGSYVCKITDDNVPGLTLETLPINVTVISPVAHLGDSLALVAFYDSLGGNNWFNRTNWKTSAPIGQWFGVSIASSATLTRVSGIALPNNNLQGRIPSALGRMDSLKTLNLLETSFSGTIPDSIYALRELTQLTLRTTQAGRLTGTLSPKVGRLTKLTNLSLSGNLLAGNIPDSVYTLTGLTNLSLADNQFTGTVSTLLGNLVNLTALRLGGNQLSGSVPTQISNMTGLQTLTINANQFTGAFPDFVWNMTSLRTLDLSNNRFIPGPLSASVQNLTSLQTLILYGDSLTGTIPGLIGNLASLSYVDLGGNLFTGAVPTEFAAMPLLGYLLIHNNRFDSMPDLSALNLNYFDVSGNKFDFGDLIPNIGAVNAANPPLSNFIYSPQDSISGNPHIAVNAGASFGVTVQTYNNGNNTFQWYRNKISLIGASGSSYSVSSASSSNTGGFYCRVTNPALPLLNLYTNTTRVTLEAPPAIPQLTSLVPGNGTATLTWRKSSDPDVRAYYLYAGQTLNPTTAVDSTLSISDTTRTIYNLAIGQRYYFRIKAIDTVGLASSYSNELSDIIKDATPPAQPTGFTAYAGNEEVKLFWDPVPDADLAYYILYRSTTPGFTPMASDSVGLVNFPANSNASALLTSHFDVTVSNGTAYYYKLAAVDSSGNLSTLASQSAITPSTSIPTWISQSAPTDYGLFWSAKFINPRVGYIAATGGLLKSTDGGANWTPQFPGFITNFRHIEYKDSMTFWAGGGSSFIAYSNNGGNTFVQQNASSGVRNMKFVDATHGWVAGNGVRYTTDGGTIWALPVTNVPSAQYRGITFVDTLNGWVAKYGIGAPPSALIYHTIDGGVNWTLQADLSAANGYAGGLYNMQMINATTGYAVGGDRLQAGTQGAAVFKTTDGGSTWNDVSPNCPEDVYGIDFKDANNGWISTTHGFVFHTTNGGVSWEFQSTRNTGTLFSINVLDPQGLGWVTDFNASVVYKLNTLPGGGGTNQAPTITLNSPDIFNGDTLWGGRPALIRWSANDDNGVAKIVVEYAKNGSTFSVLTQAFAANGTYNWAVPDDESTLTGAIRVTAYDQQGLSASSQTFAPVVILPNASYTHATTQAALTIQNNGEIGTGNYGLNKPSFQYPLGTANDQLHSGIFYLGFVRGIGDTVGVANPFNTNYYEPLTSITTTDYGTYEQSVTTYKDNFGAGLEVQQTTVSKNDGKFFITEYAVTNKSGSQINDLFLGQWFDFDVKPNPGTNLSGFDFSQLLAYIYDANNPSGSYVGMKVLDTDPSTFRRFTSAQVAALNTPGKTYSQFSAGVDNPAGDPSGDYNVEFGRGPYFISNNQTEKLAFVICAGTGLADLQSVAVEAQAFWTAIRTAPVTPTGVVATPQSASEISLSWNVVGNASLYRIYRSTVSNSGYVQVDSVIAPTTTYLDDNLQPVTTYFYKIYAVNNVGISPASSIGFTTTSAPAAPAAPTGLSASALSATSIRLNWTASASGNPTIYKIFRALGTPVTFTQIDSVNASATTYDNTGLLENSTYYYIVYAAHPWGVSQASGQTSATTSLVAPVITGAQAQHTPTTPSENQAVTISVPVAGSGLTVRIFTGAGYQILGDSTDMTLSGGNTYSYTVPANRVSYLGLWYRIKAINAAGVDIYPATGRTEIAITANPGSVATIITSGAYSSGIAADGYSTISLPLNTSLNLVPILGAQEFDGNNVPTNWRAVTYDPTSTTFSNVTSLVNNTAYFLYIRGDDPVAVFSGMPAGSTNPKLLFDAYVLKPGWNLVPWPFAFGATISVTDPAKVDAAIWQMAAGDWSQVTQVKAFGGYAIKNKTAGNVILGTAVNWTTVAGKHLADADWTIRIKAESSKRHDYFNYIGVSSLSTDLYDLLDVSEPMSMGNDVSLYFAAKNELDQVEKLASDVRSNQVDGNVWEMNVANNVNEKSLTLNWELPAMPPNHKMMIVDVNNNEFLDMEQIATYHFRAKKDNKFKIVVGKNEFVDQAIEKIRAELPREFGIAQNYPNPFNPSTTIQFDVARSGNVKVKVYNVLGQEVATLVDGYFETGKQSVQWNGKDALGRQVASGVYMYRLEAGKIAKTKKMMLIK